MQILNINTFLCTLYCHEDYIWSHWVLRGVHHMTRNNFTKLNSLQSYKGVLVLPWYNFHSCNLILVHPVMLVTWRDCGQLQKHFMQEELFYLRVDNTVHVHDWRLIINVAKRNRNGEILTAGCEVRKNEGSPAVWTCEIQGAQNMISTKKQVTCRCQGPWTGPTRAQPKLISAMGSRVPPTDLLGKDLGSIHTWCTGTVPKYGTQWARMWTHLFFRYPH